MTQEGERITITDDSSLFRSFEPISTKMTQKGERIECDCKCGALMAMRRGDKIIIRNKRHFLVLEVDKQDKVKLSSGSGVVE